MRTKRNYPALQKRYGGKYVASYKGKVIVASRKASGVVNKILEDPRRPHIVIEYIEPTNTICIYGILALGKKDRSR